MNVVKKIEYHIYDILDDERLNPFITENKREVELSFKEGKIVYEVHISSFKEGWLTSISTVAYEWHEQPE